MGMRRLFIIRKDLHLSAGKLAAMVGHCSEAYWTNLIRRHAVMRYENLYSCVKSDPIKVIQGEQERTPKLYRWSELCELSLEAFHEGKDYFLASMDENGCVKKDEKLKSHQHVAFDLDSELYDGYINGSFVKTICEAKNLNHLLKAVNIAEDLGLTEGPDFGLINDKCLTELTPENEDGTCTVGVWFRPLPDDTAHLISKKYQLYKN